jgi:cell division protein ZapE
VIGETLVAATSNTLPDKLGEGRFAAADFRREIAAVAAHFDVVRIDGPDYRARDRVEAEPFTVGELDSWTRTQAASGAVVSHDELAALLLHLRVVHPVQVAGLLDGIDAVALGGFAPIVNQGDALLFVHLIDELYDAGVSVAASGCAIEDLFPESYRHGGYRKKYGRCESRLLALLGAAATATRS